MQSKTDDNLLQQVLSDPLRREEGFRILMRQYGRTIYWHIRRIVVGHEDAEDVFQETCIKVLGSISSYRGDGTLVTWLYRVATNEALQHLRRQTHLFHSIDSLGDTLTEKLRADATLQEDEAATLFQNALLTSPTQQHIAFNLRYYDELSYEEIARITGKSVNTLKTNYHYATEKVKTYIKEHSK
jgi:RNA polymerase sigma-70 factor (ECF subfamily)